MTIRDKSAKMSGKLNFLDNISSELASWASNASAGFRLGNSKFINPPILSTSNRIKKHKRDKQKVSPSRSSSKPADIQQSYTFSPDFVSVIPLIELSPTRSQLKSDFDPLDFCKSVSSPHNIHPDFKSIFREELSPRYQNDSYTDEDGNETENENTGPGLTFVKCDLDVTEEDDFSVKEEYDIEPIPNEEASSDEHEHSWRRSNCTRLQAPLEKSKKRKHKPKQLTKTTKRNRPGPCIVKYEVEDLSEDEDENDVTIKSEPLMAHSNYEETVRTPVFLGFSDGPKLSPSSQFDEESKVKVESVPNSPTHCKRQIFYGADDSDLGDFVICMDPDDDDSNPHANSSDDDCEALESLQKFMQSTDTSFLRRNREPSQNSELPDIKDIKIELVEDEGSSGAQYPYFSDVSIKQESEDFLNPDEETSERIDSVKSAPDSSIVKAPHKKSNTSFDKDVDLDNDRPPIAKRIARNALSKRRRVKTYDQEITRVINRRTGTLKTRFRPPRPRDYSYRKLEWKCPLCSRKMKYGSRFLHQQIKHPQRHICLACPFNTRSRKKLQKHIKKKHGGGKRPQKYRCRTCSKQFCYRPTLEHHMELIHKKKPFSVTCIICKDVFSSTQELGSHYKTKHEKNSDPTTKPFKCKDCDKAYYSSGALSLHIKAIHENAKPFKCDKCDFSCVRKDKLRDHFATHQRSKKPHSSSVTINFRRCLHINPSRKGKISLLLCEYCGYVCEGCSLVFLTQRFFSNHTHKNFCRKCFIKFPHEKAYNFHTAYHQPPEEILHRCQLCKFGFKEIKFLNIHASKVHGIVLKDSSKSYDCKVCGKSFKTNTLLLIHTREHDTSKHHGCYFCKEKFITVTLRDTHLHRYHTMERPLSCPICGKGFVRNTDLIRHKKSHRKESGIFPCEVCDRKLKSKRNLRLHLQKHEKRTLYSCDVCKKSFLDQNYLRLHKELHRSKEELKPYPCYECDKGYMKKQGLEEHMVSAHQAHPQIFCQKCAQSFATGKGLVKHLENKRCAKSRDRGHNVSTKQLMAMLAQREASLLSTAASNVKSEAEA